MGKKKTSRASTVSMGGRQKANLAHEAKRQEKFQAKKGTDKEYKYTKNPYDKEKEFEKWHDEDVTRREKAKSSKLPYAYLTSVFAKLDNQVKADLLAAKEKEMKRKGKKKSN